MPATIPRFLSGSVEFFPHTQQDPSKPAVEVPHTYADIPFGGSVEDWLEPVTEDDVVGHRVGPGTDHENGPGLREVRVKYADDEIDRIGFYILEADGTAVSAPPGVTYATFEQLEALQAVVDALEGGGDLTEEVESLRDLVGTRAELPVGLEDYSMAWFIDYLLTGTSTYPDLLNALEILTNNHETRIDDPPPAFSHHSS